METLNFIKSELQKQIENYALQYDIKVHELFFGEEIEIFWNNPTLEVSFTNGYVVYFEDGKVGEKENLSGINFTCAFKTPKGYISSKNIGVIVKDNNNVTFEEATELLKFNTDAVKNTFDPFYAENEAKRRNASAWNFIASNYLQPDCR